MRCITQSILDLLYACIEVSAKDAEWVAENTGQEMVIWSNKEQKEVLARMPSSGAKTIPIMYVCYDGTSVPMTRTELAGRRGKQPDGSDLTREVKLGITPEGRIRNSFP